MLFTDTEGLAGALILTGAGAETLSDNLEAMESRMGATAMASQVIADTFENQFNRAVQTGSVIVTNFGDRIQNRLLPFVRRINEDLPSVIRDITRLGGALLIAFAPSILARIFSVGLAIRTALLLNPIGALITAISLLVGAFIALPEDSIPALDQFRDSTIDRFEAIGLSAQNLGNVINNALVIPQLSIQGLGMILDLYRENREGINESIHESIANSLPINLALSKLLAVAKTDSCIDSLMPSQPNTPNTCLLYTSPSPRDRTRSRMPSSA